MVSYVCDTSIIADGRIIELVEGGKIEGEIIITAATIAELEHQANMNKEIGYAGFKTIERLRQLEAQGRVRITIMGERPTTAEIRGAKELGAIDAKIRAVAKGLGGVLITGDSVQHQAALAEGIETMYLRAREEAKELPFEKYFDAETMSVHLKEGCKPLIKKGGPGRIKIIELNEVITTQEIRKLGEEIVEAAKRNIDYYYEIDRRGASVIQMRNNRIVISKPPFSDGFEITIVRPIRKMKLSDYKMSEKLRQRIDRQAEGIVICGPPGCGKSTFAAALAEYYYEKGKVVKTMESPRDMQVRSEITQYTALEGDFEHTKEILLLVRPDYTFYDEMRKTKDFSVFADMRLAGIGLVGVVHGRRAIDAIQRFIGKVELGVIPQVVDTVIMIDRGEIGKVYELRHVVKVPSGMREEDLARPVIEVRDFESGQIEYEMYKFGEETVVLPVIGGVARPKVLPLEKKLSSLFQDEFFVEKTDEGFIVRASHGDLVRLFKKHRNKIKKLQERFGEIEFREI
ncbi:MAG: ATPase, T2SS/T4P/T4SS family [Candidatus Bilamarchaeaceae archaeon]